MGLAETECPLSGTERLQLSVSRRLKCTRRMLKSNGAFRAVRFTEVVRNSKAPLREVPMYICCSFNSAIYVSLYIVGQWS